MKIISFRAIVAAMDINGLYLCLALGFLALIVYLIKNPKNSKSDLYFHEKIETLQNLLKQNSDTNLQSLQGQIQQLSSQVNDRLNHQEKSSQDLSSSLGLRLDNAAKVFSELQGQLGQLSESNKQIFEMGKDLRSLQEILSSPKARGGLGELLLESLLAEILPKDHFQTQYSFKNNEKVDAVIQIGSQLLPIDSKFPLENFKKLMQFDQESDYKKYKKVFLNDVKKHIDSISRKYILPQEGTLDFALMYVPAENVFYEMIIRDDEDLIPEPLQSYALKKKVIPVSPNSFYAYLIALMQALKGEKVRENVHQMIKQLNQLAVDFKKFRTDFEKVGYHLNNLNSSYEASEKRLDRYEGRIDKIHELEDVDTDERSIKLIKS